MKVNKSAIAKIKCRCGTVHGLIADGSGYLCGICLQRERDALRAALERAETKLSGIKRLLKEPI